MPYWDAILGHIADADLIQQHRRVLIVDVAVGEDANGNELFISVPSPANRGNEGRDEIGLLDVIDQPGSQPMVVIFAIARLPHPTDSALHEPVLVIENLVRLGALRGCLVINVEALETYRHPTTKPWRGNAGDRKHRRLAFKEPPAKEMARITKSGKSTLMREPASTADLNFVNSASVGSSSPRRSSRVIAGNASQLRVDHLFCFVQRRLEVIR